MVLVLNVNYKYSIVSGRPLTKIWSLYICNMVFVLHKQFHICGFRSVLAISFCNVVIDRMLSKFKPNLAHI